MRATIVKGGTPAFVPRTITVVIENQDELDQFADALRQNARDYPVLNTLKNQIKAAGFKL